MGLCPQVVDLGGPDRVHDVDQAVPVDQVTVVQDHLALNKGLTMAKIGFSPYDLAPKFF